jgi:hypothetical protein
MQQVIQLYVYVDSHEKWTLFQGGAIRAGYWVQRIAESGSAGSLARCFSRNILSE